MLDLIKRYSARKIQHFMQNSIILKQAKVAEQGYMFQLLKKIKLYAKLVNYVKYSYQNSFVIICILLSFAKVLLQLENCK